MRGAAGREVRPEDVAGLAAGLAAFRGRVDAAVAAVEADLGAARAALAEDAARQQAHAARATNAAMEVLRRGPADGAGMLSSLANEGAEDSMEQRGSRMKHPKRGE